MILAINRDRHAVDFRHRELFSFRYGLDFQMSRYLDRLRPLAAFPRVQPEILKPLSATGCQRGAGRVK